MPKLRSLSGQEVIAILNLFVFVVHSQRGSHINLIRILENKRRQTLTVPNHKELNIGTLRAIFGQVSAFVPAEELRAYFYTVN